MRIDIVGLGACSNHIFADEVIFSFPHMQKVAGIQGLDEEEY